jgi:dienelactone hydrolase
MNDYARKRARMLAELGYTAFALDMYGDGKQAHHPDDAGQFSSAIMKNQDLARARFNGALEVLRKEKTVDPRRIAAIGYCFGGAVVLQMARYGTDLKGVVSFHGNLVPVSPARPGAVKAKILVLTGAADSFVPPEQVEQFKKEMDAAKADYRVIAYPGAKHSFTNPEADEFGKQFNLPLAYNEEADHASWKEMQEFFRTVLK